MIRILIFSILFILFSFKLYSNNITQYEYWFDDNYSNKVQVTLNSPAKNFHLIDSLQLPNLNAGLHKFNIRFKDSMDWWNCAQTKYFMYPAAIITGYEYWFDDNFSDKIQDSIISPSNYLHFIDTFKLENLNMGFHKFSLRFKDGSGQWKSTFTKYFIYSSTTMNTGITGYEYWFDDNYSHKVQNAISPTSTYLHFIDSLELPDLSTGLHKFCIRFKGSLGDFNSVLTKYFIYPVSIRYNKLSAYEYWFDDKYSNKVQNSITPASNFIHFIDSLQIPKLDVGLHILNIRFGNSLKGWSSALQKCFTTPIVGMNNKIVNYRYWFDNDTSAIIQKKIKNTSKFLELTKNIQVPDLPLGNHLYNIQLLDTLNLCSSILRDTFQFNGFELSAPELLTPVNGGFLEPHYKHLEWDTVYYIDNYQLQAGRDSNFTSLMTIDTATTLTTNQVTGLNDSTLYYWRVRAQSVKDTSDWSAIWQFGRDYQYIYLKNGWNLISSNINLRNNSIDSIFSNLINTDKLVIAKNESGGLLFPLLGINSITGWYPGKAFWLYSLGKQVLTMGDGSLIYPQHTPIILHSGWNYVAYLRYSPILASHALASIDSVLLVVRNGDNEMYYPAGNVNTLEQGTANVGKMVPGKGYLIYVTKPVTLVYPEN